MKKTTLATAALALAGLFAAAPAHAGLKPGDKAPLFTAQACQAGKALAFSLEGALKRGPLVLYFYPSAYTKGCDLEAHTFSADKAEFAAAGAGVLGVSDDDLKRLKDFSADPNYCAGAFPVASDADGKIAKAYGVGRLPWVPFLHDVRGDKVDHGLLSRTTYVIAADGRVAAVFSHIAPDEHAKRALEAVRKLKAGR